MLVDTFLTAKSNQNEKEHQNQSQNQSNNKDEDMKTKNRLFGLQPIEQILYFVSYHNLEN